MKTGFFLMCAYMLLFPITTWGKDPFIPDMEEKEEMKSHHNYSVNFGIKGGFTSSLFLISKFRIKGIPIEEIQNNYKIGYFGSVFMRLNFDRHFLQPEISYNINRCDIAFDKPSTTDDAATGNIPAEASITSSIHSIEVPVIYGYNIIKEGAYSLAIFGGPKLRYIWDKKSEVTFKNFDQYNIEEKLRPLNVSLTTGVAVTISRVFFDFRYDMGLHNISKRVTHETFSSGSPADPTVSDDEIHFRRRDNVLSFSLGIFF